MIMPDCVGSKRRRISPRRQEDTEDTEKNWAKGKGNSSHRFTRTTRIRKVAHRLKLEKI